MKLRQKLAMVLATAMVVTAVPVVTFGASTNRVTNVVRVTEDTELTANLAPQLVVELKDGITSGTSFYVNLENAEWSKDADGNYLIDGTTVAGYTLKAESETELRVTATADNGNDKIYIPMLTKVKAGEAKAIIEETKAVTGGTYVFATTQAGSASVKVEDTTSFYSEGGKIGTIILTENTIGAFAETADDNGKVEITAALDSSDFTFSGKPVVTLDRGFKTKTIDASNITIDKDEVTITIDKADLQGTEKGRITIKGAEVSTKEKAPEVGELKVQILNDAVSKESVKVAEVADYGVSLTVKDDKVVEFVAGNAKEVEFTLKEKVKSTMANDRKVEFTLGEGHFDVTTKTPLTITLKQDSTKVETIKIDDAKDSRLILDKDDNVIGVELTTKAKDSTADSITVNGTVVAEMDQAGDIKVKAEGRAIGAEVETVVAKANAAVKIEAKGFNVEAGVKGQKGGQLVITETDKGMLKKGNLEFYLPLEDGLTFTGAPTVEVTAGDIKLDTKDLEVEKVVEDNKVVGYKVSVPVTRASKEASTIEVKNFEVKLDRTVPTGKYDLEVKGSAIGTVGSLEQEGFFAVGISGEQAKVTTTITNDATEMVVNGEKVTLPAAAYIKNGKLMAPLRAVANAFGFENSAINYNSATKEILIRGNGSVIKLTVGSSQAYVNGTPITLSVPAEIKADSTYVPVGDLGRLLGINVQWDNTTKTATFNN